MKKEEILEAIRSLAKSQGFYSRLLEELTDEKLDYLEKQGFEDYVDLIMFLES